MEKEQKTLPLPSAHKARNGTMIKIIIILHSSKDGDIMGIIKLLKLLAENPQCKSLGNARNVSTDPTLGIL